MTNLHDARVEAAARELFHDPLSLGDYTWGEMVVEDPSRADLWRADARRILAAADAVTECLCYGADGVTEPKCPRCAADAVVTVDGLQERIEDTLAYYQCRETNPKADHPSMGYHAFSEEQREFLRAKKSEAAAEIVRMILALIRGGGEQC